MKVKYVEFQASVMIPQSEILGLTTLVDDGIKHKGLYMDFIPGEGLYINTPKLTALGLEGFVPEAQVRSSSIYKRGSKAKIA